MSTIFMRRKLAMMIQAKPNVKIGDAVYHNGSMYNFFDGDTFDHAAIVADGWTAVGAVYAIIDGYAAVVDTTGAATKKYADVVQLAITAISSTSIVINIRAAGDYANNLSVSVTLADTSINATNAAAISTALDNAGNAGNVGYDKHKWWAYYDEDNSRIIVQCDTWSDYRQYTTSGTGCTINHVTWGDMPANSSAGTTKTVMNLTGAVTYYSTNGKTPTTEWTVNGDIVKRSCFEDPNDAGYQYCDALRAAFDTYEEYVNSFSILPQFPLTTGCFSPTMYDGMGKTPTLLYGGDTAPVKGGGTKYKFPALNYPLTLGYSGIDGISPGDWYLPGVYEGAYLMADSDPTSSVVTNGVKSKYNVTLGKMGKSEILNSSSRWFAQRCNVTIAWHFSGITSRLHTTNVNYAPQVAAVTLLQIK